MNPSVVKDESNENGNPEISLKLFDIIFKEFATALKKNKRNELV